MEEVTARADSGCFRRDSIISGPDAGLSEGEDGRTGKRVRCLILVCRPQLATGTTGHQDRRKTARLFRVIGGALFYLYFFFFSVNSFGLLNRACAKMNTNSFSTG